MNYLDERMARLKPRGAEELEQALGLLVRALPGGEGPAETARRETSGKVGGRAYERLLSRGLIRERDGRARLSPEGERLGRGLNRRHLLAERLLSDILDLRGETLSADACRWEHVLSPEATRAICVLLGHPRACPHGERIPEGDCCADREAGLGPLLSRLSELERGEEGRLAYLAAPDPETLRRLLSLGLSPGARVVLRERFPACVVELEGGLAALERELADEVFVRRAVAQPVGNAVKWEP